MYSDLSRPPLHAEPLRRALLRPGSLWTALDVRARTASTNADVAAAARAGAAEGLIVVAEEQLGGRGRLDRRWVSPARAGLTFSILVRPGTVPVGRWGWLPLLAGVALTRAVRRQCEIEAFLKWPNDLLVGTGRRKAAGLLAEVVPDGVVLGIGLNITTRTDELAGATTQGGTPPTSLALEDAGCTDRDILLRAILRELAADYTVWRDSSGDPDASGLRRVYSESCATLGERVRVDLPGGGALTGEAVDIDNEGRLVIDPDTGGEPVAVAAGDVVHARPI